MITIVNESPLSGMSNTAKILDYDKLVETYSANLDVNLRGFRAADEMLDTWVPDEDHVRSLSSLVEAAQLCGSESVSVRVSNKTLGSQSATVKEKLASLGEVACVEEKDSTVLTISKLQETAAFRSVRPIYLQKLRARLADIRFKRALKVPENFVPLRVAAEQYSLACGVQPELHVITDAVFDGPALGPMSAVLDCLCEMLIGLPILEARDHTVIRLEFSLRDPAHTHPISGIVLPQNADPVFRLPSLLMKRLFDDYLTSTSYRPGMNFYDAGPRVSWSKLSPTEREQRVTSVLESNAAALGLRNGEVQVVDCKHAHAVTVRFGNELALPTKQVLALSLERLVRQKCDPRLEVFCEEKKDLSSLRRAIEHVDHDHTKKESK